MIDISSQYLTPFQRKLLLKRLESNLRPEYKRRIEIMLLADAGASQAEICQQLQCSSKTARYWILIAKSGQAHSWDDSPMGRPRAVNEAYLQRLQELVLSSPREHGYVFRRWTAGYLRKHLAQELGIEIGERHINRLLKQLGLSTRSSQQLQTQQPVASYASNITIRDLQVASIRVPQWSLQLMQIGK